MSKTSLTILYITDIHGSEMVWVKACNLAKKYGCDALVIGGDWFGKRLVEYSLFNAGQWIEIDGENTNQFANLHEKEEAMKMKINMGCYVVESDNSNISPLKDLTQLALDRLINWLNTWKNNFMNNFDLIVGIGNDDPSETEELFEKWELNPRFYNATCGSVMWNNYEIVSIGHVLPTPWKTHRECSEDDISNTLRDYFIKKEKNNPIILLSHCPPYNTIIDCTPVVNENLKYSVNASIVQEEHIGSKSLRKLIESGEVLLGMHGHLHDSVGIDYISNTPVCNPGSRYWSGTLLGYFVTLQKNKKVKFKRVEW